MLSDAVHTWLKNYDDGQISGMELYSMLESHLRLHPEEIAEVMVTLHDNSDPHLQFVGTLISQRANVCPIQQPVESAVVPKSEQLMEEKMHPAS